MFRFIHAADVHLDSPFRGLEAYEGAPAETLRGATRRALENLVSLALTERVSFLAIAGDLYDGDWKDLSTGLFFHRQMVRLKEAGIRVYLISGNHDALSVITRKLSLPENVYLFSTRAAESVEVPGLPVVVHGQGFSGRAVPQNLAIDYPPAVEGCFNLGMLHTSLNGREGHDSYAPCSVADLLARGYDYWALGHIHQPEIVHRDPWIVFSGNCQGRSVRETGPRGCRLVTVDSSGQVQNVEWQNLDVVRWEVLRVDLTGVGDEFTALGRVAEAVQQGVVAADTRLLAARVVFCGTTSLQGSLLRDLPRWRAEVLARAGECSGDAVWIEKVCSECTPVFQPDQLAGRDPLTGLAIESLERLRILPDSLPDEVRELLDLLPVAVRSELQQELLGDGGGQVLADVRGLILDALGVSGGARHEI